MAEQLGKEMDINSYTENYLRLHLLEVIGGTLVLRNLFLKIVKSSPANGDVDKYLSYFKIDIKSHKHASDEFEILFPSSGKKTDLGKWDVSLLAYVLIHCCTLEGQFNLKGTHNRSILNKEIENKSDLSRFLSDNQTKLRALKITEKQYEILYPGDLQNADLKSWDIELVLQVLYTCFNDVWVKKTVSRVCTEVLNRHVRIFSPAIVLDDFLKHHQCKFDTLKMEKKLTDIQYKQIFPIICDSDTGNWNDEVLICVVVNTCQSLSQDTYNAVKTIRQLRKELGAHTAHAEINNDEFLDKWTVLYKAIFEITITEIPEIKNDVEKTTTYIRKGPLDIQNAVTYLKPWYANQDTILKRLSDIESKNESTNATVSRQMKKMMEDIEDLTQKVNYLLMRVPEKEYNARRQIEELKVVVTTNAENKKAEAKAETCLFKSLDGVEDDDTKQLKDCTDSIRKMHLNDGNEIAGTEKGSIILVIKCSSLRGVHNLLKTLNSNELKDTVEQLQDVLSKINECPIRLGVHLTNSSLLKIVDMIAKYALQTEETSSPDEPSLLQAETQLPGDHNKLREVKQETSSPDEPSLLQAETQLPGDHNKMQEVNNETSSPDERSPLQVDTQLPEETSSPDEPSLLLAETQLPGDHNKLREVNKETSSPDERSPLQVDTQLSGDHQQQREGTSKETSSPDEHSLIQAETQLPGDHNQLREVNKETSSPDERSPLQVDTQLQGDHQQQREEETSSPDKPSLLQAETQLPGDHNQQWEVNKETSIPDERSPLQVDTQLQGDHQQQREGTSKETSSPGEPSLLLAETQLPGDHNQLQEENIITMSDDYHNVSRRLFDVLEYVGASEDMRNLHQTTAVYGDIAHTMNSHLTNRPVSLLTFGSNCEGTTTPGLNSDIDVLCCRDGFHVKENIRDTAGYDISVLMVRDNHTQPGYVKLQLVADGIPQTVYTIDRIDNIDSDCDGRICIKHLFNQDDIIIERNGPADSSSGYDFVLAFKCATVPRCASEWIRRQRPYCWPSAQMIDQMKVKGCYVVGVGHPGSDEKEIEWRLSFSLQERQLMFSFNPVQHKCYILLKMIKHGLIEPVLGKSISSYHCKTCMFHVLENTRACMWRPENLYSCVRLCLIVLRRFVVNGNCPNYFIKEENMFDRDVHKRVKPRLIHILTELISAGPLLLLSINCDQIGECMIGRENLDILSENIMVHKKKLNKHMLKVHCIIRITINRLLKEKDLISSCCWLLTYVRDLESCVCFTTDYDEHQTREAIRHIIPFVHSRLTQQLVSLACSTHDILLKRQMLHASMYHLKEGSSCDVTSSRLARASVLYKFGKYDKCMDLLDRILSDLQPNVETVCCCSENGMNNLLAIPPKDMPSSLSTTSCCVTYLPSELTIVPVPLQYEMSRSVDTPPGSRGEDWYDFAAVDGRVYPHVLKYLINSKLNRIMHKRLDISNLRSVLENERYLGHRETGYNLLGWIYIQENRIPEGVKCLNESWMIRPHHNAAKWHIWSLVNTLLSRVSGV